jgi:hypothetical protein
MDKVQNDQQAFLNVSNHVRERDLIILRSDILVYMCVCICICILIRRRDDCTVIILSLSLFSPFFLLALSLVSRRTRDRVYDVEWLVRERIKPTNDEDGRLVLLAK